MKHDILIKYKPEVTKEQKAGLIPEIQALFDRTKEIPGIHNVKLYPNVVERENRYDLLIEIDMEREALDAYDHSEWHHQWKEQYGVMLEKKAIFDHD
ncbi:MAG: Dabb family protein [Anaerolineaceae bacterium]|nr:Dabb family protein [Anaerolineaceae bacterium]